LTTGELKFNIAPRSTTILYISVVQQLTPPSHVLDRRVVGTVMLVHWCWWWKS